MNAHRTAARRLSAGSAEVARRMGAWAVSGGPGPVVLKGVIALAAVPAAIRTAHEQPILMPAAGAAWCIAAWRASKTGPAEEQAEDDLDDEQETQPSPPADVRAYLDTLIRELIGDRKGVHLDTLLAALQDRGTLLLDATVADLRRDLAVRGFPTRDSLKVDRAVRVGIHRDDLQPLPDPALAKAG